LKKELQEEKDLLEKNLKETQNVQKKLLVENKIEADMKLMLN